MEELLFLNNTALTSWDGPLRSTGDGNRMFEFPLWKKTQFPALEKLAFQGEGL